MARTCLNHRIAASPVDQFQDILYRYACARDTWFTEVDSWVNGDSVH